jgi:hypothetical protein
MAEADGRAVAEAARARFGPVLSGPATLVFALFREAEPGGPFRVAAIQDHRDPAS